MPQQVREALPIEGLRARGEVEIGAEIGFEAGAVHPEEAREGADGQRRLEEELEEEVRGQSAELRLEHFGRVVHGAQRSVEGRIEGRALVD